MIKLAFSKFQHAVIFAAAGFLCACAAAPPVQPVVKPVYPPPPEQPRFVYEMTIFSSAQVTEEDRESRMRRLLTGERSSAVALSKPFDVAVCRGTVFVSDTVHRFVHVFDFPNRSYRRIGKDGKGQLTKPMGLSTDDNCRLYVADRQQRAVLVFDPAGDYLASLGGAEYFTQLSHVAASPDGRRLYAVDTGGVESQQHHIRVFDTATGNHLMDIGSRGTSEGEFNFPKGIDVGPDGLLRVVDSANFRVQVLDAEGRFQASFGSVGARYGNFARPKGLSVDPSGNTYVVDAAFGNFQIFDPSGQLLLFIGDRGERPGPGVANLPSGIDVDEDGRIYFVDQFFRKVDVFRPSGLDESQGYLGTRASEANS